MFNLTLPPAPHPPKKIPGKKTDDKRTHYVHLLKSKSTKTAYCKIYKKDPQQEESMLAACCC